MEKNADRQCRKAYRIRHDQCIAIGKLLNNNKIASASEFIRSAIDDRLKYHFGIEPWRANNDN